MDFGRSWKIMLFCCVMNIFLSPMKHVNGSNLKVFFFSLSLTSVFTHSTLSLSLSAAFSSRRVLFSNDKNLSINFIFSSLKIWVCQLFCIPGKFLFFSAILSSSSSPQSRSNPSMDPLFWCLNLFLAYKKVSTAQKMWLKFLTF